VRRVYYEPGQTFAVESVILGSRNRTFFFPGKIGSFLPMFPITLMLGMRRKQHLFLGTAAMMLPLDHPKHTETSGPIPIEVPIISFDVGGSSLN
jgi:hypothetical protein